MLYELMQIKFGDMVLLHAIESIAGVIPRDDHPLSCSRSNSAYTHAHTRVQNNSGTFNQTRILRQLPAGISTRTRPLTKAAAVVVVLHKALPIFWLIASWRDSWMRYHGLINLSTEYRTLARPSPYITLTHNFKRAHTDTEFQGGRFSRRGRTLANAVSGLARGFCRGMCGGMRGRFRWKAFGKSFCVFLAELKPGRFFGNLFCLQRTGIQVWASCQIGAGHLSVGEIQTYSPNTHTYIFTLSLNLRQQNLCLGGREDGRMRKKLAPDKEERRNMLGAK